MKLFILLNKHELKVIADENVQLLEIRSFLGGPCGYDQRGAGADTAIALYQKAVNEIREMHRDFQLRFIFTRMKQNGSTDLTADLREALRLRKNIRNGLPDLILSAKKIRCLI